MEGMKDFVILKGEKISGKERMCDCIIFDGKNGVSVSLVELKCRMSHASDIAKKLNNGGKHAKDILEHEGLRVGTVTAAILARRFHRHDCTILRGVSVMVGGRKYRIFAHPCGTSLRNIRRAKRPA